MQLLFIFSLLIFLLLIFILFFPYINESFTNLECNKKSPTKNNCIFPPKYYKSKCLYGTICTKCPYQPPDGNIIIPNNETNCCKYKCNKPTKRGKPYYCNYNGQCIVRYAEYPWQKFCGVNRLNTLPKETFDSIEMCLHNVNPYRSYNKIECLETDGAGWCTDYTGEGLCIPGTPWGPTDMRKYHMCYVNQYHNNKDNKNAWEYYA